MSNAAIAVRIAYTCNFLSGQTQVESTHLDIN